MSDEPKLKPPVRPTPDNAGDDGGSGFADAFGNFVLLCLVIGGALFFLGAIMSAAGG